MEFFELAHKRFGTTGLALSTVATLFFSAVYAYHVQLSRQRPGEAPMKWSWLPIIGSAIELGSRPLEFLSQCAEENNEIFGMVVAGKRMFIVADVLSCNVVLKPPRFLSYEEFIDLVLENFFGANFSHPNLTGIGCLDEHLMRTWYNNLLR